MSPQLRARHGEPPPAERVVSRHIVFGIATVSLFMESVDFTIVATALHAIHQSLHAPINWAGWMITIYGIGMVVALPAAGKISDQFGRRRVLLFGIIVFTTASLFCGFATNIYVLILFRGIQALGGGVIQPCAAGLVADHFGESRDRAIGMFGTILAGGQLLGPVLGGLLVGYLSWRWIFFVNVPIGLVLSILIVKYIPDTGPRTREKVDVRGLLLLATSLLTAIIGITNLGNANTSVDDPTVLAPLLCSLLLAYQFFRHSFRTDAPLIPVRFFRERGFAVMNLTNFLWGALIFGVASLVPLYAQERYHFSALNAGTLLTARAIGMISVGAIATFALRRTGYRKPLVVGFVIIAAGTIMMSLAPRDGLSPYLWLSIGAAVTGLGHGVANPSIRNGALQLAPNDVAAITGLRIMMSNMGNIMAVSIVTAILNRSADRGIAQSHILWVAAGVIVFVMTPLVLRIPEHKGSW